MTNQIPSRKSAWTQPAFLVVVALLLLAAIALNTAADRWRLYFKKEAVPMRRDFHELPPLMGNWLQVSEDEKLEKNTEEVLGTDQYLYRDYVNIDQYAADLMVAITADEKSTDVTRQQQRVKFAGEFANKSVTERAKIIEDALKTGGPQGGDMTPAQRKVVIARVQDAISRIPTTHAQGVIDVGLTYYTGLVDTVAHIPDRCYIADGYVPTDYTVPTWNLQTPDGKTFPLQVRFINFEDQTGDNRVPKTVAYVFHVNGHYESDPESGVRKTLQSLTERYGYYAKIELMTVGSDQQAAADAMTDFLSASRGQIESCLPDWINWNKMHGSSK